MQRKYIYGFIALSFAISMELVLALHIITRGAEGKPAKSQLVSTIDIPKRGKQAGAANGSNTLEPGMYDPELDESASYLDEEQRLSQLEGMPDEGYPVMDEAGTLLDEDHAPGSEPADSENTEWSSPDDSYPPPDDYDYGGDYDPWANYPPPGNDNQPTPIPPTATLAPPTATLPLATATLEQPTATQAPAGQPSATLPPTPVTPQPQATQPQAPTAPATPPPAGTGSLVSARAAEAPILDGSANDPAWAAAQALTVDTSGGANQSATRVTVKASFDEENVYFLLTWADPSQSFLLNPWEKQAGGSWKRLVGAENRGNDESEYFQDKLALLWPINNSLPGFAPGSEAGRGCAVACHSAEEGQERPLGVMFTGGAEQFGDLWQLKSVMNAGQVDDGYLDGTSYSKESPRAGFQSDPGEGGYRANKTKDGGGPAYMPKDGGEKTGAPGYILDAEKEDLAERLFDRGERVPGIVKAPFEGDRGDIRAGWKYQDGVWILEIARKRVTGSEYDVQFDDFDKSYFFALATFDNTQIRHAVQSGVVELTFKY